MKQNVVDDYNLISGQQKAAILMLSLDEERSAALFSLMDDEEIKELSVIMASLGKVNSGVVEQLFQEFTDRLSSNSSLIGTYETTERLLAKALDKDRVSAIMDEISRSGRPNHVGQARKCERTCFGQLSQKRISADHCGYSFQN